MNHRNDIQSALNGSKTEKNLMTALNGESKANTKYSLFANRAREEGYGDLAKLFDETAGQEKEHAEIWLEYLGGIGDTAFNLEQAAAGEGYEFAAMYPEFARIAEEEGFDEIADKFRNVGNIEKRHNEKFQEYIDHIKEESLFSSNDKNTLWLCRNCGHVMMGKEAPERCPVCSYAKGFFVRYH